MEIYSFVTIAFYVFIYLSGVFFALAGDRLGELNNLLSPFFSLIGIICLLFSSRKIAVFIYSTVDSKQFVSAIAILMSVLFIRYIFNSYRKNNFKSKKLDTLDSVFM